MPELPEVETVRRRLLTCLPGLLLREVVVNDWTVGVQTEQELNDYLAGRRVTGLRRRGKYLLVDFGPLEGPQAGSEGPDAGGYAGPSVAVVHLRMTGQLIFRPQPGARPARFEWRLEPATTLFFQDVRRFGRLWAFEPAAEDGFFGSRRMGPEPFGPEFTPAYLRGALQDRRAPLKAFLLDQRHIAGVGNIYADEALFRARLHPLRSAAPARGHHRDPAGRHRPRGLEHRELHRSRGAAWQLPGDPERLPAHRGALPDLRHDRRAGRRRRSRHALLPALPAAPRRHGGRLPPPARRDQPSAFGQGGRLGGAGPVSGAARRPSGR